MDRDDNGGGRFALPRLGVWVKVPGGEDANVFGVRDRLREAGEEVLRVFGEEGNGEGVDGELGLVGGEAEGQPGRLAHWERFVELGGESVEIGCEGGSGSRRVRDEEGDRPTIVDLGRDREGEDAVRIPEDTSSNVGEGGCDHGRLLVLGGGGTRSVESSFGRGERLRWLRSRHTVAS